MIAHPGAINVNAVIDLVRDRTQSYQRSEARDELTVALQARQDGDSERATRFALRALRAACGEWSAEYRSCIAPLTPAQASAAFGLSESEVQS